MADTAIRCYDPADLPACRALWVELTEWHRELYGDATIGGADPGRLFDRHLEEVGASRIWLARLQGDVAGFVSLVVDESPGGELNAEVAELVVSARHRRRGVGLVLLEYAIAEARRLGVTYLSIRPVLRNAEALRLYHRAGFDLVGQVELFMDLQAAGRTAWQPAFELFDLPFRM